jgi:hypothetical protein
MPNALTSLPRLGAGALAAVCLLGVTACGGGDDDSASASADAPVASTVETAAPTTTPATTVPETTTTVAAVVIEATDELTAFASEHGALVADWSAQLEVFGEQAVDHLDDLSAAPASPGVREVSDELVAAVGADATDPGLVTLRDFAASASEALGLAADGDHPGAFAGFLDLQTQADDLTAVVDLITG